LHLLGHAELQRLLHLDAVPEIEVSAVLGSAEQPTERVVGHLSGEAAVYQKGLALLLWG
jgi:hypothetical protein